MDVPVPYLNFERGKQRFKSEILAKHSVSQLGPFYNVWRNFWYQNWGSAKFSSVQFSCSVLSDSLQPHESQHARPPCPYPTPRVSPNSCSSSQWCHPAISSSVVPFSSCPQSLPASGSFSMSQLFTWAGQSIGVSASASVLPMNIQGQCPLGSTGLISLQHNNKPWLISGFIPI